MDKPESIRIKIRPIRQKAARARLPGQIGSDYPLRLVAPFIHPGALQNLKRYAASDLGYELGGVLVGRTGRFSRRRFIEIVDFIPATRGVSHRAAFEFTNDAQQEIHEIKESRFKDLQILGWFHTHPGYGIFLSSADEFIDDNYFTEKFHVAVVLDPTRPGVEAGVFVWDGGTRLRVPFLFPD